MSGIECVESVAVLWQRESVCVEGCVYVCYGLG